MIYKVEKILITLMVLSFISFVSLSFLKSGNVISTINNSNSGFESLAASSNYVEGGVIKLSVSTLKNVKILINGEENYASSTKGNIMNIAVKDLDVVEVDLRQFKGDSVSILVLDLSNNINAPKVNEKYTFTKGINKLFCVKMK